MLLLAALAWSAEVVVGVDAATVQDAVHIAQPGDVVVLPEGDWSGPVVVDRSITLTSRGGVLVGETGRTLTIDAPDVAVDGLVLRGSGDDLAVPDACVYVTAEARGVVIRDSQLSDCLFGIWLHEVTDARVIGNEVIGRPGVMNARKGNGIHVFHCVGALVDGNEVRDARDGIYVGVTEDAVISNNTVSDQRYGIHYMYSSGKTIEGNIADGNSGGIALMQSRQLTVRNNVARGNEKAGILFRDAMESQITGNVVENNGEGMFFFSSYDNTLAFNTVRGNQMGARVWAGTSRNDIHHNSFVGNRQQIFYVSASDQTWGPNYWSDYVGWDQDGDGHGDVPYRNNAMTAQLLHRYPQAVLLLNSPTLEILGMLQARLPALRVPTVIDESPLVAPPVPAHSEGAL